MSEPIDSPGDVCGDCKRLKASAPPKFDRDPRYCYAQVDGRSRRSERNCAGVTIRRLKERVRELEAWQNEIRITRTVHNPPPGDAIHAAVAIADAGLKNPGQPT